MDDVMFLDSVIFCPLVDEKIRIDDCSENREIKEEFIPRKFKVKKNWKEICKNCKYQDY